MDNILAENLDNLAQEDASLLKLDRAIPLTERTYSGSKYFNQFNMDTGGTQDIEVTQAEYEALAGDCTPTLAAATWRYSYTRPAFSTGNTKLGDGDYGTLPGGMVYVKIPGYMEMSVPASMVDTQGQLTAAGIALVEVPANTPRS